jgi:hypothetical protein
MANKGFGRRMRNNIMNWVMGGSPAVAPTAWFISAHTGDPGDNGQTANEASGGSYARVAVTAGQWNDLTNTPPPPANDASSIVDNNVVVAFPVSSAAWSGSAPLTYYALWDHVSNTAEANFIGRWPQTGTAQSITGAGQQLTFAVGAFAPSAKPEP